MPSQIHADQGSVRIAERAQPLLRQRAPEIQPYGTLAQYPIALDARVRAASVEALNQILADTMMLRDLYKKHHWQVAGHTFYQLHLLFDKHYGEQSTLVDALAERIQSLGGVSVAVPHDVAEMTRIERPPRGREEVPVQLSRLLEAHEIVLRRNRGHRGGWPHQPNPFRRPQRQRGAGSDLAWPTRATCIRSRRGGWRGDMPVSQRRPMGLRQR